MQLYFYILEIIYKFSFLGGLRPMRCYLTGNHRNAMNTGTSRSGPAVLKMLVFKQL
jgi:hypothetical protein